MICGCGPKRLYDGPSLPRESISMIEGEGNLMIDGVSLGLFTSQFEALPGVHDVLLKYVFSEEPTYCSTFTETDYSAQSECEREQDEYEKKFGSRYKSCWGCEFDELKKRCIVPVYDVECKKSVNFIKGSSYHISARRTGVRNACLDLGNGDRCIEDVCIVEGPRDTEVITSCGTGCYAFCS